MYATHHKTGRQVRILTHTTSTWKNKKTLVKASLGRLVDKLNQYNEIYNIWDMDTKDIINLLPKEFNKIHK